MMTESPLSSKVHAQKRPGGERISIFVAGEPEREEIYRVRHEVYACELGQHPANAAMSLRDPLDAGNVYLVARVGGKMAGFISVTPPGTDRYSIDKYFPREH